MAKQKPEDDPSTPSMAWEIMAPRLGRANTLLGGTEAMKSAGQAYLPLHPEETSRGWNDRLHNNVLFNFYEITLNQLAGKPFDEPVALGTDIPEEILPHLEDVNLQGDNIDAFGYEWFRDGLRGAVSCVLVEYPRSDDVVVDEETGEVRDRTRMDDINEGLRPYWIQVPLERILHARTERVNGVETFTHVRIEETVTVQNGFVDEEVTQIRVLEPGLVQLWRKEDERKSNSPWVPVDEYETGLGFIPLVAFYTDREAPMQGRPILDDLTFMNIRHWQSMSDQIRALTIARFPMLLLKGLYENEQGLVRVGPEQAIALPEGGDATWLESTGSAIQQGRDELTDLEERMAAYGAQVMRKRPAVQTATARVLDTTEAMSVVQAAAVNFQSALEQAILYHAIWMGLTEGGTLKVRTDFTGIEDSSQQVLISLKEAQATRVISTRAYIDELKRRGALSEDYNYDDDRALVEEDLAVDLERMQALSDLDPEGGEDAPQETETE